MHVPIEARPDLPFAERIALLDAREGRLGYHARHIETGRELSLRADERFGTASVIKVALCACLLDLVGRGDASLDEQIALPSPRERVAGGGILKQLEVGALSLRDLVELTITLSDNVATNAVLERCGGAMVVNAFLDRLGLHETRLPGPVDFTRIGTGVDAAIGVSTPREQVALLSLLMDGTLTGSADLLACMRRQHYLDQLPRWLGWNTYAQYHGRETDPIVANKTGELDGLRADVGVVTGATGGTAVIAIFCDRGTDLRETVDNASTLTVAECGAAICAELLRLDT